MCPALRGREQKVAVKKVLQDKRFKVRACPPPVGDLGAVWSTGQRA